MTDRRPHWDDSLIEAVAAAVSRAEIDDYAQVHFAHEDLYAVIAAVEAWHKAKRGSRVRTHAADWSCWRYHDECAEALIESQQAAIQRVREIHRSHCDECRTCVEDGWQYPCPTIRALGGDA